MFEVVASQNLWIWHAFFGSAGSLNDINILNNSPIFNKVYDSTTLDSSFVPRGTEYKFGYYLVDGIYPELYVFVKSFSCPIKNIEQTFGALKKCWQIVAKASVYRDISTMTEVMYTCIILHNMIIEHEGNVICVYDENEVI